MLCTLLRAAAAAAALYITCVAPCNAARHLKTTAIKQSRGTALTGSLQHRSSSSSSSSSSSRNAVDRSPAARSRHVSNPVSNENTSSSSSRSLQASMQVILPSAAATATVPATADAAAASRSNSSISEGTTTTSSSSSSNAVPISSYSQTGIFPVALNDDLSHQHPCTLNPCKNNGICVINGYSFICKCPEGFSGDFCQQPVAVLNPYHYITTKPPRYPVGFVVGSAAASTTSVTLVEMRLVNVTSASSTRQQQQQRGR